MRSLRCGWLWLSGLLVLGCAAPETPQARAQDDAPPTSRQASKPDKKPAPKYRATILQRGTDKPFELREVTLFVPEVSLFGGDSGKESDVLELRRGATRLEVPLERLAKLEIGEPNPDADRIDVTITLRPEEGQQEAPPPLRGTVKANLELRGRYEGLKAVIKLREAKEISLEIEPPKEKEKEKE